MISRRDLLAADRRTYWHAEFQRDPVLRDILVDAIERYTSDPDQRATLTARCLDFAPIPDHQREACRAFFADLKASVEETQP